MTTEVNQECRSRNSRIRLTDNLTARLDHSLYEHAHITTRNVYRQGPLLISWRNERNDKTSVAYGRSNRERQKNKRAKKSPLQSGVQIPENSIVLPQIFL